MCLGTCLGVRAWKHGNVHRNVLVGMCAVGESQIWEEGIVVILTSMLASITSIMYTSYIQY